ncbi:unnamed protein product [Didymodactylos carnosus]|uniref:CxC5 like cysteine cluster associated with KDZ domain-containing protein n=1 Tax=Didymodactylos carnosus TaxID=1234261 RepID=A0A8S2D6E9_9BILA|nr:unnamed protein product [Didymodactylos carnosus]CAF3672262.1 unnamed protein product [Didymodactylos carnosus]
MDVDNVQQQQYQYTVDVSEQEKILINLSRKIKFNHLACAVKLSDILPNELGKKLYHIVQILNMNFNTDYQITKVSSAIDFVCRRQDYKELFSYSNVDEMIKTYHLAPHIVTAQVHMINLEPYTNKCIKCGHELKIELHAKAKLLYKLESVEKCTISTASCTNCLIRIYPNHYTYGKRGEDCFVTRESIKNKQYVYFSGGYVYDQKLIQNFEKHLLVNHMSFSGFAQAQNEIYSVIEKCQQIKFGKKSAIHIDKLSERSFQSIWLFNSLAKFEFMTTSNEEMNIPSSLWDKEQRNQYLEENKDKFYEQFVSTWTRHSHFTRTCGADCSKIFILDGHQKANRLVCKYRNIYDHTIPEFEPTGIQIGCPYTPVRKTIYNHLAVDPNYCEQHQAHSEELKKMFKKQQGVTASHVPQQTSTMKDVKPPTKSATTGVRTRSKAKKEEENKFENDIDKRAFEGIQPNDLCNVYRDGITSSGKISSFGFLATFLNCKVIVGFDELPMAEGSE